MYLFRAHFFLAAQGIAHRTEKRGKNRATSKEKQEGEDVKATRKENERINHERRKWELRGERERERVREG